MRAPSPRDPKAGSSAGSCRARPERRRPRQPRGAPPLRRGGSRRRRRQRRHPVPVRPARDGARRYELPDQGSIPFTCCVMHRRGPYSSSSSTQRRHGARAICLELAQAPLGALSKSQAPWGFGRLLKEAYSQNPRNGGVLSSPGLSRHQDGAQSGPKSPSGATTSLARTPSPPTETGWLGNRPEKGLLALAGGLREDCGTA